MTKKEANEVLVRVATIIEQHIELDKFADDKGLSICLEHGREIHLLYNSFMKLVHALGVAIHYNPNWGDYLDHNNNLIKQPNGEVYTNMELCGHTYHVFALWNKTKGVVENGE